MKDLAPIALFVYNRPELTNRILEALSANELAKHSHLYIYADGPKPGMPNSEQQKIEKVRDICVLKQWCKEVTLIKAEKNQGLAQSIIGGVSSTLKKHERVIVLEDDILVSPSFLNYMNDALLFFESNERVASVHAFSYPAEGLPEYYFLRGADCWGWATWRRAWSYFSEDGAGLFSALKRNNYLKDFDFDGAYSYSGMLKDQIAGRNNSWAIRWHASMYLQNMLTLYPGKSFVENIGLDGSGTHCESTDIYSIDEINKGNIFDFANIQVEESSEAKTSIAVWLKQNYNAKSSLSSRIREFLGL